jgi:hypothetical protein
VVVVGYDIICAKSSSCFYGYNLQGSAF